jgi:ABC-type transport system substrate-binding protein
VNRLIDEASRESDEAERWALLTEAEQLILDDAVTIPIFWPVDHVLIKPCVVGYPGVPMTIPKYRYVEIDPTK